MTAPGWLFDDELMRTTGKLIPGIVGDLTATYVHAGLKLINGRLYRNIEELRAEAGAFIETYNRHWLMEKLGFKSPWQARQEFDNQLFKATA